MKAAQEILKSSRNRIYLDLRFLEQALFRLRPEEKEAIFLGCNGEALYYNEEYLLRRYLHSPEAVGCDYLHMIIHCLYQHPFQAYEYEEKYWDLATDIAVTDVIREMELEWILEQIPGLCFRIAEEIRREVLLMSAGHITRYLRDVLADGGGLCGYSYEELKRLFQRDSHVCWYRGASRKKSKRKLKGRTDGGEDREQEEEEEKKQPGEENKDADTGYRRRTKGEAEEGRDGIQGAQDSSIGLKYMQGLAGIWKEAAESVLMSSQSFTKGQGKIPGSMILNIQKLVRERYDYAEFLRRFAVMNEKVKVNLDEFDYTYYLYGLRILEKIPLIEPLEYKEEYQVKDFVIVIDTSGSCSEGLAQRFLNKTYNILKQTEHFAEQVVIHVIQCDAAVQEDIRITSLEHLEEYIHKLELKGGGGTDFRPAFEYVDRLYREKAFQRLCGLIYFTDGYGTFPGKPPDYKTAFVFVERDDCVEIPPWAIRLYLEEEEV